jgi:hypothetical protein
MVVGPLDPADNRLLRVFGNPGHVLTLPSLRGAWRQFEVLGKYGSPKLWKYRPGPMTFMETFLFLAGFVVIWGYPLVFLVMGKQWFLLIVYAISTAGFFMTLKLFFCSQCMNLACPLNSVNQDTRQGFLRRNSEVAQAWGGNQ